MSWKKNVFSYLMWFVYASLVTAALVSLGSLYCRKNGIALYWGILFVVMLIGLIGGIVFFLRRFTLGITSFAGKRRGVLLAAEIALVTGFLTLGGVLRILGMEGVLQPSEYYESAKIVAGQDIPQIVHGAVYFYLQVLREIFFLFGNRFIAGIWLQAALQFLGSFFLFFAVRKLAGRIAALTVLGFCMCAPFQVQEALVLSPEMLLFCIFAFSAFLIAAAKQKGKKPILLIFTSILAAICCYLDVIGIILLFLVLLAVLDDRRGEADSGWKKNFLLGLAVLVLFILGFMLCAFSDAFLSGKSLEGVIGAWLRLYYPESFQLPVTIGGAGYETENLVLFGIMAFGVFSFWCDRKRERISPCIAVTGLLVLGMCYGVLTEEMPGFHYLYLLLTLLAGIGLSQCFCPASAGETEKKESAEDSEEKDAREEKPKEEGEAEEEKKTAESEERAKEEAKPESEERTKEEAKPESEEKPKEETKSESEEMTKFDGEEKPKVAAEQGTEEKPKEEEKTGEETSQKESETKTEENFKEETNPRTEEKPKDDAEKITIVAKAEENQEETEAKAREISDELEREKALKEEFRQEAARWKEEQELEEGNTQVKYIENPLPLPKKHIKRVMEYSKQITEEDDFDHPVSEDDDFDI